MRVMVQLARYTLLFVSEGLVHLIRGVKEKKKETRKIFVDALKKLSSRIFASVISVVHNGASCPM